MLPNWDPVQLVSIGQNEEFTLRFALNLIVFIGVFVGEPRPKERHELGPREHHWRYAIELHEAHWQQELEVPDPKVRNAIN